MTIETKSVYPSGLIRTGINTRELFAAMAMQGLISADGRNGETWERGFLVKAAVDHADALIAELAKVKT